MTSHRCCGDSAVSLSGETESVKQYSTIAILTPLLMLATGWVSAANSAGTFRVTTKIFVGDQVDAASEHQILFDQGLVYDVPQINRRFITVFDQAQKRVTLLDRETQVQTSVGTDDLVKITAQARAAVTTPEQRKKLGIEARVESAQAGNGYTIKFANLEYRTTTQKPHDPVVAADYAMFVDMASRLNLVRRLGPPPFGRMTLHQQLAALGELPLELTLTLSGGKQSEHYRSTHAVGALTDLDRGTINEVRGFLALYRQVDLKAFPK